MSTVYKIHPAIGVARMGTSAQFTIGPETPGGLPTDPATGAPVSTFRDANGELLKQAARFRVFAYDSTNPDDPGTEVRVGADGVEAIEWTVYLANKKAVWYQFEQLTGSGQEGDGGYLANGPTANPLRNAGVTEPAQRQQLILDPGPRTIGGTGNPTSAELDLSGSVTDPNLMLPYPVTTLGAIQLDGDGNLLVLAGNGDSGTTNINPAGSPYQYVLLAYANNDGWFDDTSDGPVTAQLVLQDGSKVGVDVPAWCLGAPPKYAPQILNLVTLHDTMYDIAVRELNYAPALFSNGAFNPGYQVNYQSEIAPILARPGGYTWVANLPGFATRGHAGLPGDSAAQFPIGILRTPASINDDPQNMPILAGDNPITDATISKYLTVTETQYFLLNQWVSGKVTVGPAPPPPFASGLDEAALESCVGGAFCPGIEMAWVCRNPTIYGAPFRIRMSNNIVPGQLSQTNGDDNDYSNGLEPGDIIKYMAQPWQADFNECSIQPVTDNPNSNSSGVSANFWWWPAQRPYSVYPSAPLTSRVAWTRGFQKDPNNATLSDPNLGDMQMVVNWKDLGFITQAGGAFIETGRNTPAIDGYMPPLQATGPGAPAGKAAASALPAEAAGAAEPAGDREPYTSMAPRPAVRSHPEE
ncbi:MAG: hypothetical protein JWO56_2143 [Acidobacteria bacterium]|nr:hypothetical protein [Acidobacteriota bacterium]